MWVRAICMYGGIARDIAPRRARLAGAQTGLAAKEAALCSAQAALAGALSAVAAMQVNTTLCWQPGRRWRPWFLCHNKALHAPQSQQNVCPCRHVERISCKNNNCREVVISSVSEFCYRKNMRAR